MEGLKGGAGGGGGMDDIFSMFMGGGRGGGQKRKARVKPQTKQIDISLADVYNGKTVEIEVDR